MERATRRTRTVLSLCLLALAGMARPGRAEEVVEEGRGWNSGRRSSSESTRG